MSLIPFRSLFDDNWLVHDPFRDEFFGNMKSGSGLDPAKQCSPLMSMDIVENDGSYQMMADLPGVDASDLDLSVEGNSIVLKAERKHVHEKKTDKVHRLERSYGTVTRKFAMPKNADMNNANTSFKNGVLTVNVPKLADVPPSTRKLTINTV